MISIIQVQNSLSTASWRYTDILVHHPTSSHIPQKHAVHICKTVQYRNLFSGSGWLWQFGRFTVESSAHWIPSTSKLSESDLKGNILHDWMITCFPISPCNTSKGTTTQQKTQNLTVWFHPSTCHSGASLGLESHLDRLNRFATAIVWGFRKSLKPNSPGETSIPCFGRPTFHRMAWFFEEGKLSIHSFHQSKTPRKQKRYLNI